MAGNPAVLHLGNAGNPQFRTVDIDINVVGNVLQAYVDRGSTLTGVALTDINTRVRVNVNPGAATTLLDLLTAGMRLFDAIVWMTAQPADRPALLVDPIYPEADIPTLADVARAVFYVYFILLTQARYPNENPGAAAAPAGAAAAPAGAAQIRVPNFLNRVMMLAEPPHVYMQRICSFNPRTFDPRWIRHVNFAHFGQEALSRFGLGVAGYRMFAPFKLYPVRAGAAPEAIRAAEFAAAVARSRPDWAVHPLTRNPAILTERGNLNRNLANLMLECFTQAQLQEMVTNRTIFELPTRDPNHNNWRAWGPMTNLFTSDPIFLVPAGGAAPPAVPAAAPAAGT